MNYAYIHLILNHIPITGLGIVLVFLIIARLKKSPDINRAAWTVLVLIGIITVPTYFAGTLAEDTVEKLPEVTEELIEIHEERALIAMIMTILSALLGGVCLWMDRVKGFIPRPLSIVTGLAVTLAFGAMLWTADAGGEIRHTEIRSSVPVQN